MDKWVVWKRNKRGFIDPLLRWARGKVHGPEEEKRRGWSTDKRRRRRQ